MFLTSAELQQLDAIVPTFDPLEVLAWTHRERPHTRFLAWLLDPHPPRPGGGHGLGTSVLRALVERAVRSIETLPGLEPHAIPRDPGHIDSSTVQVLREAPLGDGVRTTARAPDIRCLWKDTAGTPWVLLIENKIDAAEGDGQVRDYLVWASQHHPDARRMLLYVTPDGRTPESRTDGEVVVPLTWSDVADAASDALSDAGAAPDPAARGFITSVLEALRMRFGGRADVRALIEALHDAYPRACAMAAAPDPDSSIIRALRERYPNAAWHLRTLRPRAHQWTRSWVERVAAAFRELAPSGPALVPGAPHAECSDIGSWSIEGVTHCLSLYVMCTPGRLFNSARPRLWLALRGPNQRAPEVFAARDQLEQIERLPTDTRNALMNARPVHETPATWRWLCVGQPAQLPRGYSPEDDARRVARAIFDLLAPHLGHLADFAGDHEQHLYSCDLDPDHVLPIDERDQYALDVMARPDATRVLILTRQPTGHMYELRRESDLGATLAAVFGGDGSFAYGYGPAATLDEASFASPRVVVAGAGLFRAPEDGSLREAMARLHDALAAGATLFLFGERWDAEIARRHLGDLLAPVAPTSFYEEFPDGDAEVVTDDESPAAESFAPLVERDVRWLHGAACVRAQPGVSVPLWFRARGPGRSGELFPLVARWRAGATRVVWWAGGAYGTWGRALQQRPEQFGRWWRAVMDFATRA